MSLKAYKIYADDCEAAVIAFAETPSKAKAIGRTSEWLCDYDWTDLKASREKKADEYASEGKTLLDGSCVFSRFVMWTLQWYSIDGARCDDCGSSEWDGVEQSTLSDFGESGELICTLCRDESVKNAEAGKTN